MTKLLVLMCVVLYRFSAMKINEQDMIEGRTLKIWVWEQVEAVSTKTLVVGGRSIHLLLTVASLVADLGEAFPAGLNSSFDLGKE
jgi:hypothetical protein